MGKMLQDSLKRPTHAKCNCTRCKAKAFVSSVYPTLDDTQVLAVAEKIVKALRASVVSSRHRGSES